MCLRLNLVFRLAGLVVIAFSCIGRRFYSFLVGLMINHFFTIASVCCWFFAVPEKVTGSKNKLINILILMEVFLINSVVLLVRPLSRCCSDKAVAINTVVGR